MSSLLAFKALHDVLELGLGGAEPGCAFTTMGKTHRIIAVSTAGMVPVTGPANRGVSCLLSAVKRTHGDVCRMSAYDPGCVKTPCFV
jgi:hypothetical protein